VAVIPTGGSIDNKRKLAGRDVQLAPMQASAIRGNELCVVAPLFYESAHLLVRQSLLTQLGQIGVLEMLAGRSIAVGPSSSGSRRAAEMILETLELTPEICPREIISWSDLDQADAPDIAIICVGQGSKLIERLLQQRWQLLAIPQSFTISAQHPTLRPVTISPEAYPGNEIPSAGIATVGTMAFFAARRDAPSALVRATLDALYEPPPPFAGLLPRERAAEWQGLDFHPESRRYFTDEVDGE
ncbi:MAG: TAXI family TRAP transporter solute-binding subunit, partial [Planctomycetota bacterium]